MRFLLRTNLFRISKAFRSARHNKCCVLAVTSTSNGTDTTNTNCVLPKREEPGEEWTKREHLERKPPADHGVVIMPTGGTAHVGKTNDEGSQTHLVTPPSCSILTHPVPLILSAHKYLIILFMYLIILVS